MEREEILRLAIGVAYRVVRMVATETPPQGDLKELFGALGVDEVEVPRSRDDPARTREPGSEEYVDWSERFCVALSRHPEAVGLARSFIEGWDRRNAASIGTPRDT